MTRCISILLAGAWFATAVAAEAPSSATLEGAAATEATRPAEEAARAWLTLVDAERYAESWEDAAALFQKAVSKEQWVAQGTAARSPLGKVVKRELRTSVPRTNLPGAPDGEYVVIEFVTAFEHKKVAVETVTPARGPDGRWRVSGYFIR